MWAAASTGASKTGKVDHTWRSKTAALGFMYTVKRTGSRGFVKDYIWLLTKPHIEHTVLLHCMLPDLQSKLFWTTRESGEEWSLIRAKAFVVYLETIGTG